MNKYCVKIKFLGTNKWVLRKYKPFRYNGYWLYKN